jgi:hypothetical protein
MTQVKIASAVAVKFVHPPARLKGYSLAQLLEWYETHLCIIELLDPRGHEVAFDISRFPYLIKLMQKSGDKLKKPLRAAERIKAGELTEQDFGGFNPDRSETLSWLPSVIETPLNIRQNVCVNIPGDEVYVRQVQKQGAKFKLLFCERMGSGLLVPVTSFRQEKEPKGQIIWP